MSFKAYVAGRTSDRERVREVQQIVRDLGGEITFDWTTTKEEGGEGGIKMDWSQEPERARVLAHNEIQAVRDADVTIAVYKNGTGLGKYIEIGVCLGAGRHLVLMGEFRESVFWYADNVHRINFPDQEWMSRKSALRALLQRLSLEPPRTEVRQFAPLPAPPANAKWY
jgi:hypothetical protein